MMNKIKAKSFWKISIDPIFVINKQNLIDMINIDPDRKTELMELIRPN